MSHFLGWLLFPSLFGFYYLIHPHDKNFPYFQNFKMTTWDSLRIIATSETHFPSHQRGAVAHTWSGGLILRALLHTQLYAPI